jgi:uroporphyrinogen decarboxylase
MTKRERLWACVQGKEIDRPPISFWHHFPGEDLDAEKLALATLRFQQCYDLDFIKLMPNGLYAVLDWGVRLRRTKDSHKADGISRYAIHDPLDWDQHKSLDPTQGVLGQQLKCLEILSAKLQGEVPLIQTIFSPLTIAAKLCGADRAIDHLRNSPQNLHTGLKVITQTTMDFVQKCIALGAEGLFFATQWASYKFLNEAEYHEFGKAYDLPILNLVQKENYFNILHIHGEDIMFDLLVDYPVQAINWHDRGTSPALGEAVVKYGGGVLGGLDHQYTMSSGTKTEITQQVQDAISQTKGRRLIIGPGCVLAPDTAPWRLHAARKAVEPIA